MSRTLYEAVWWCYITNVQIEKLGKIGIGVGITVGALLFFMLILSLPNLLDQHIPDYDAIRFEKPTETQELNAGVLMDIFTQTEDYAIFVQRNPEYAEDLELYRNGGHLRICNT